MQIYEIILKFNTFGVKNFSDLTIIKISKQKTAHFAPTEINHSDLPIITSSRTKGDMHQLPGIRITKLQCYNVTRYILVEWGMCQV